MSSHAGIKNFLKRKATPSIDGELKRLTTPEPDTEIQDKIIDIISCSLEKQTPRDIEREVARYFGVDCRSVRKQLARLVRENIIQYTNVFGRSVVEKSYHRPARVSNRIIIKPPVIQCERNKNDVVIELNFGTAFGTGAHPTTTLCLKAIDRLTSSESHFHIHENDAALDIGTGSGILAIAAAKLGFSSVTGTDIDPCSVYEAKENVQTNKLLGKVRIEAADFNNFDTKFKLIIANLRYPTLKTISRQIESKLADNGAVVLSGVKTEELDGLFKAYSNVGLNKIWVKSEKNWSATILTR